MTGPQAHLPEPFQDEKIIALLDSIGLVRPISIRQMKVTAAFHIIYVLTLPSTAFSQKSWRTRTVSSADSVDLILRIAGDHIPRIKTENEAAILTWLRQNTSIPVPDVISYDVSTLNPLRHEYILFNRCTGVPISDIYDTLSTDQMDSVLEQLIQMLAELHSHPFHEIGGMMHADGDQSGPIVAGPVLDENFWFAPDVTNYFPQETVASINVKGPYSSYTEWVVAMIQSYMHIANTHSSLAFLREYIPRLDLFIQKLREKESILNRTKIRLVHKDLHFANILYDQATQQVTAILDWEFAGTFPFQRWDPVRAFLWSGKPETPLDEKYRLRGRFKEMCQARGVDFLQDAEFTSELQEKMQIVVNYLRAIVTAVPKGECLNQTAAWTAEMVKALEAFGV